MILGFVQFKITHNEVQAILLRGPIPAPLSGTCLIPNFRGRGSDSCGFVEGKADGALYGLKIGPLGFQFAPQGRFFLSSEPVDVFFIDRIHCNPRIEAF